MPGSPLKSTLPPSGAGRVAGRLAAKLRTGIADGRIPAGEFLPTERELAAEHGLAVMTVRRALQTLQREGLVAIEPRHGCRVLVAANDPRRGCPVAHVLPYPENEVLDNVHQHINHALQRSVARRGWSMLGVHVAGHSPAEVLEQLRTARAWGIVLEALDPGLLELIRDAGIPVVLVNAWSEGAAFDAVLQDNYQGGFLAAGHLIARGHRRIAWFGPVGQSSFSRERLGGAAAALAAAGLELPAAGRTDTAGADLERAALKLLSGRRRPTAVLALWTDVALALAAAARKLKLVLGRDLDMVGWAVEERYDLYVPAFGEGVVPPMVTWKVADLARTAVARLAERRADPELPAMRINVATRLRMGSEP
jgi:DNA-binding LacI/PurR family transcriptional regulator